jgi:dihydrofolate reductase
MATLIAAMTMSVDGYIAGEDDSVEHLFDWYDAGDVEVQWPGDGGMVSHVSAASAAHLHRIIESAGAIIVGRRVYDITHGYGGSHPVGVPLFLVTHHPPASWPTPDAPFTAVPEGVAKAVELASAVAGDKVVSIGGPGLIREAIELDLLDELYIELAPVVLGKGIRFFEQLDRPLLLDDPEVVEGRRVTHLRYRVQRDR